MNACMLFLEIKMLVNENENSTDHLRVHMSKEHRRPVDVICRRHSRFSSNGTAYEDRNARVTLSKIDTRVDLSRKSSKEKDTSIVYRFRFRLLRFLRGNVRPYVSQIVSSDKEASRWFLNLLRWQLVRGP